MSENTNTTTEPLQVADGCNGAAHLKGRESSLENDFEIKAKITGQCKKLQSLKFVTHHKEKHAGMSKGAGVDDVGAMKITSISSKKHIVNGVVDEKLSTRRPARYSAAVALGKSRTGNATENVVTIRNSVESSVLIKPDPGMKGNQNNFGGGFHPIARKKGIVPCEFKIVAASADYRDGIHPLTQKRGRFLVWPVDQ